MNKLETGAGSEEYKRSRRQTGSQVDERKQSKKTDKEDISDAASCFMVSLCVWAAASCCSTDCRDSVDTLWAAENHLSHRGAILTQLRIRLSAASVAAPTTHNTTQHNITTLRAALEPQRWRPNVSCTLSPSRNAVTHNVRPMDHSVSSR